MAVRDGAHGIPVGGSRRARRAQGQKIVGAHELLRRRLHGGFVQPPGHPGVVGSIKGRVDGVVMDAVQVGLGMGSIPGVEILRHGLHCKHPDIRVLAVQTVPEDFHARYAAHTKTYLYRIHNHPIDSPFDAAYYTRVPRRLDEAAMQAAAQQFVGTHDFLALCAAGSSAAAHGDTVRTITDCHVTRRGDEVDIEVTADGYLYNMVRILAGTLCEVGAGRLRAADIPAILASRDRSRAGPTLPAKGLFLKCVEYPERKEEQL